jgi:hypothetical protein
LDCCVWGVNFYNPSITAKGIIDEPEQPDLDGCFKLAYIGADTIPGYPCQP